MERRINTTGRFLKFVLAGLLGGLAPCVALAGMTPSETANTATRVLTPRVHDDMRRLQDKHELHERRQDGATGVAISGEADADMVADAAAQEMADADMADVAVQEMADADMADAAMQEMADAEAGSGGAMSAEPPVAEAAEAVIMSVDNPEASGARM